MAVNDGSLVDLSRSFELQQDIFIFLKWEGYKDVEDFTDTDGYLWDII